MLREVSCDLFVNNGKVRPPIVFNDGLNVVLGGTKADNSIGKSLFLMIIDFCFGGDSYANPSPQSKTNTPKYIGHHAIKFCFEFGGKRYYFMRQTNRRGIVIKCDDSYAPIEEISRDEFCEFLRQQYGVVSTVKSFREACSLYMRIHGKDNCHIDRPLDNIAREAGNIAITRLERLFPAYV